MNAGVYPQPLTRKTTVMAPVVSGYVAARLRAVPNNPPATSGVESQMQVVFENVGSTAFAVKLRETDDRSTSGTRYDLTAAVSLVPGGRVISQITGGNRQFLEVFCTGTTTGQLRMQIDSLTTWNELGFSKADDGGVYYPTSLYQAKTNPGVTS